jgi:hypothetical protein
MLYFSPHFVLISLSDHENSLVVVAASQQQNQNLPPKSLALNDSNLAVNKTAAQTHVRVALTQSLPQAPLHPLNISSTGTISVNENDNNNDKESLNILKQQGTLRYKSLAINKGSDRESLFHIFSFLQEESELEGEIGRGGERDAAEGKGFGAAGGGDATDSERKKEDDEKEALV